MPLTHASNTPAAPTAADPSRAESREPVITLEHVVKRFGSYLAVQEAHFAIGRGEFFSMLGPSGCGKTTTLRMIAGFEQPTEGRIMLNGKDVSRVPPYRRNVNTVFQHYALFPHMSVADNVAFGPRSQKVGAEETSRRVDQLLTVVKLAQFADRKPGQLSGGQQQRVALARALVTEPRLLLLDEPLSALDASLREEMRELVREVQEQGGYTTVFVTHDQEEAVVLADRIALLFDGKLQMYDEPQAFYERPVSRRIARFFGATTFIHGRARNGRVETPLGSLSLAGAATPGDVTLTIRPEAVRLGGGENSFSARVTRVVYLGTRIDCGLEANGVDLRLAVSPDARVREGEMVTARLPAESLWVLGE